MNLEAALSVTAGGPGSGCEGPNCGRPKSSVSLVKMDTPAFNFNPKQTGYHILYEGTKMGRVEVHREEDTLVIDWVDAGQTPAGGWQHFPQNLHIVKDVLRQLKNLYPGITKISGDRISGVHSIFRKNKTPGSFTIVPIHAYAPKDFWDTKLHGFSHWQEELIRGVLSRIPLHLTTNFKAIEPDSTLGAKHGNYDENKHIIKLNPRDFYNKIKFGQGPGRKMDHAELTIAHEVGHSVYYFMSEQERGAWRKLSGWKEGGGEGQAPPYKEKRSGWPPLTSTETHKKGIGFTRRYGTKTSHEDFADCFGFYVMGQKDRVPREKRAFLAMIFKEFKRTKPSDV